MDDMDAMFVLARLAGPVVGFAVTLAMMILMAPALLYILARWRAHREPAADPQLGLKFALYYFGAVALHVALFGGTVLLFALFKSFPSEVASPIYRASFGALLPGALVLGAQFVLLARTNDAYVPGVRRLFTGYNLVVTGLVAFIALVGGFQVLLARGNSGGLGHFAGAALLVYGSAAGVLGFRFGRLVLGDGSGGAAVGGGPVAPMAPPPPAPPPAGLPPLGGGAYPPIAQ